MNTSTDLHIHILKGHDHGALEKLECKENKEPEVNDYDDEDGMDERLYRQESPNQRYIVVETLFNSPTMSLIAFPSVVPKPCARASTMWASSVSFSPHWVSQ